MTKQLVSAKASKAKKGAAAPVTKLVSLTRGLYARAAVRRSVMCHVSAGWQMGSAGPIQLKLHLSGIVDPS